MTHTPRINQADRTHILSLHETFKKSARRTGCSTAAASFLILGALIVIGASSLCLTLPGVNVISNVILPGTLPGCSALLLSTPFIVYSVRKAREKNSHRKELVKWSTMLLNFHRIETLDKQRAARFITKSLFEKGWTKEYRTKLLSDITELYPEDKKDQSSDQKKLLKAIEAAKARVQQNK